MPEQNYAIAIQGLPQQVFIAILAGASVSACIVLIGILAMRPPDWAETLAGLRSRPWTLRHVGMLVAVTACGLGVMAGALSLFESRLFPIRTMPSYFGLALGVACVHLPCLAATRIFIGSGRIPLDDGLGLRMEGAWKHMARGVFIALAMIPLLGVVSLLYRLLLSELGVEAEMQSAALMVLDTLNAPWYTRVSVVILTGLLVPIVEETVFRGIGFPVLAKRFGLLPSAALLSLVFATLHLDVGTYLPLFVLSMGLCLAYAYSGSIIVPVTMHASHNLIQIALLSIIDIQV